LARLDVMEGIVEAGSSAVKTGGRINTNSGEANPLKRGHDSFNLDDATDLEHPYSQAINIISDCPREDANAGNQTVKGGSKESLSLTPSKLKQECADSEAIKKEVEGDLGMPTPPVSVESNKRDGTPTPHTVDLTAPAPSPTASNSTGRETSPEVAENAVQNTERSLAPPSAFAALDGIAAPPAKRVKLTFAEKEMKKIQKEIKDQERVAEKAKKEAARQAIVEEKVRREAEKETQRKNKEAEKEEKRLAIETAKEEKKREKEEEKRRKEEAKRQAEDEKKKKEQGQKRLSAFFPVPASTARRNSLGSRTSTSPAPPGFITPTKPVTKTPYETTFMDFFAHSDVTMAPITRFPRDEEASHSIHSSIDAYINGDKSLETQLPFNANSLFHLSGLDVPRGRRFITVKEIMTSMSGDPNHPIDLTSNSQNSQIKQTRELLRKIPVKFLKFQEDVRPPYSGTYTSHPIHGIHRLARNPLRRDLPETNYDYDSEAEWVEDEDAEDLNSEGEEDEEIEDGEDMDGFLDDENDELLNSKRMVIQGDLEPISTGLCWENHKRKNTNVKLMPYRMEIILGIVSLLLTHHILTTQFYAEAMIR
jgi:chromatin assembly factor 1 subunit A